MHALQELFHLHQLHARILIPKVLRKCYKFLYIACTHRFMSLSKVGSVQFKSAIDLFMSEEAWPCGVSVKRFFKPKNG